MLAEHLLLVPGMMCDARLWRSQLHDLDMPCSVPALTGSDSITGLAAGILADAPPRFAVAGLSMGGIVALELWRQARDRISHLALIDTNPFADSADRRSLRLEQIQLVVQGGLRDLAVDALKPAYLARSNRDNEELLQTILDMALDLGPDVFRDQSIALRNRADYSDLLPTIDVPTSVICGAEDALCPVAYHEHMATRIPDCTLIVLDDCGHLASMERPDAVTGELEQLLTRTSQVERNYAIQS